MKQHNITIIGGSGFLGQYVVKELVKTGANIRVACRYPDSALHLKTAGPIGQVVPVAVNINDEQSLSRVINGSDTVINLVGVLYSKGKQSFSAIHAQGAERVAKIAKASGCTRFIHISALAIDQATSSNYARSKIAGEKAVIAAFPEAVIIRPSIIIGAEDNFINKFAKMAMFFPALPLIGSGNTLFQPVYVGDVAKAITATIASYPSYAGNIIELGGPACYSFKQILQMILYYTHKKRRLVTIPFSIARLLGLLFEWLPVPVLTSDQVNLLQTNNVITKESTALKFDDLRIEPVDIEPIVRDYLSLYTHYSTKFIMVGV